MLSKEIRSRFLNYFKKQGHTIVQSDGLVPQNDPTLLFTSAGMVQFKDHFLGRIKLEYTRATTSQKCLRTSDIENVGRTARHHTFFEMLGNFSFGDYFKQDAIRWAWEFVTVELGLPKDKLYVTIYQDDEEAYQIWKNETGVEENRIIRLGEDSNFWKMGETGPCGPCSEILVDQGESFSCDKPDCAPGCSCDRYLEIWNLVFTQFDRQIDGKLEPLPRKNIDTGAGLERIAAVMQKVPSNFDTDLFKPVLQFVEEISQLKYGENKVKDMSFRVIADHARALTFAFSEGILPSNEGRGYVLRRILRRAYRHGKLIGIQEPFLYRAADIVIDLMKDIYPELVGKRQHTMQTILAEEKRFESTLNSGLRLLDKAIEEAKTQNLSAISPETIFKLYDTYGFPVDLTQDILEEQNLSYSKADFEKELEKQQNRSRAAWTGSGEESLEEVYKDVQKQFGDTNFLGYKKTKIKATLLAIVKNGQLVDSAQKGDEVNLIFDQTSFYAESGGQVGDTGLVTGSGKLKIEITDTRKFIGGSIAHIGKIISGKLKTGQKLNLAVDTEKRHDTARNHTATHLLMAALRKVLGEHVEQGGSLVTPTHLRFDFTHFQHISTDEINRIEELINLKIRENIPVRAIDTTLEQAQNMGALAFFGEKYGEEVRVIEVEDFDKELCGGTHLQHTGDIGLFLFTSSSAIGSGLRRFEAITGTRAYQLVKEWQSLLHASSEILKIEDKSLPSRIEKLMEDNHELNRQLDKIKIASTVSHTEEILSRTKEVSGIHLLCEKIEGADPKSLLTMIDALKPKINNTIVALASVKDGKISLLTFVTPDLVSKYHAGKIISQLAKLVGGGGGGRPDIAQAGGKDPEKLDFALSQLPAIISGFTSN